MPIRRSDVIESIGEKSLTYGVGGIFGLALGGLLYYYRGDGYLIGLAWLLLLAGGGLFVLAVYAASRAPKVESHDVQCPYCSTVNVLTEPPMSDFTCTSCHRVIPVEDGVVLPVFQVRCGYCNELNFYSQKNQVLICEKCDHEIPIATEEGKPQKHVAKAYAVSDDERLYELVLVSAGQHKQEDLISALQHMLALNRGQVKQLLEEVPATLLTGITRKKAEMLQAQLAIHEGAAEFHPIS
jgi:hypothetical protein